MISKWKHWLHILPVHVAEGILLACQQAPSKGGKKIRRSKAIPWAKQMGVRALIRERSEWDAGSPVHSLVTRPHSACPAHLRLHLASSGACSQASILWMLWSFLQFLIPKLLAKLFIIYLVVLRHRRVKPKLQKSKSLALFDIWLTISWILKNAALTNIPSAAFNRSTAFSWFSPSTLWNKTNEIN